MTAVTRMPVSRPSANGMASNVARRGIGSICSLLRNKLFWCVRTLVSLVKIQVWLLGKALIKILGSNIGLKGRCWVVRNSVQVLCIEDVWNTPIYDKI